MKTVDQSLFTDLHAKSAASPRGRSHFNLHPSVEADIHRLVMSAQPNSYVRPHRHARNDKWELLVILHGEVTLLTFDDNGTVTGRFDLRPGGETVAVEIPENTLHCFVARQADSAVIEVKRGPYVAPVETDFAPWAPAENDPAAPAFLARLKNVVAGDNLAR